MHNATTLERCLRDPHSACARIHILAVTVGLNT